MKQLGRTMMVALLSVTLAGCWFTKASRTPLEFSSTPPTTVMVGEEYRYDITVIPEAERDYVITVSGQPDWLELQTEASLPVNVGNISGDITYMAAHGDDIYFYGTNLSAAGTALETGVYKTQLDSTEPPLFISGLGRDFMGYGGLTVSDNVLYFAKLSNSSFIIQSTEFHKLNLLDENAEPELISRDVAHSKSIAVHNGFLYSSYDGNGYIRKNIATGYQEHLFDGFQIFTFGIDSYNRLHMTILNRVSNESQVDVVGYGLLPENFSGSGAAYEIDGSGCITGIAGTANLGTYIASSDCYIDGERRTGDLRFVPVDWPSERRTGSINQVEIYEPGEVIAGSATAVTTTGTGRVTWASKADRALKTFTVQQNTLVGTPTEAGTYDITLTLPNGATQSFTLTVTEPPVSYDVAGTVYGLQGALQLSNNGTDIVRITTSEEDSSPFGFTKQLQQGEAFDVEVFANPAGQTCSLRDQLAATGNMGTADVELIVDCEYIAYNINGSVEGLNGELELLLTSEQGEEELLVSEDGDFSFTGEFILGDEYSLTVKTQPIGQMCEFAVSFADENGEATNPVVSGPVDLPIVCTTNETPRTMSVTVTGLPDNTAVEMQALGPQDGRWEFEDKAFTTGTAAFDNTLLDSEPFAIGILTQPEGYFCIITDEAPLFDVADGLGIVDGDVTITVGCEAEVVATPRTLSVTVTGLADGTSVTMRALGAPGRWDFEDKAFTTGTAAFSNTLFDSEPFAIGIQAQPDGYSCVISDEVPLLDMVDGLGIVDGNVTVTVSCTADVVAEPRTLSVTVVGLPGGTTVPMRAEGPIDGRWLLEDKAFANGTAAFNNTMLDGEIFDIRFIAQPDGFSCSITGESPLDGAVDGLGIVDGNVTITVDCTANVVATPRSLFVTVIGLPMDGTTVAMRAFGPDDGRWLQENKAFATGTAAFNNTMLDGETFDIRIISDPAGYSCSITDEVPLDGGADGFGEVNGDVTITVNCVNN
ncbi:hypothetical protein [Rheinheimera fenheensis]|uniref:hypothetical protein n=1 Tax=Rheinheimera fenheensis TaxID=3152295 RepID=UPI0032610987